MSLNFSAFEIGRRALNANQAGITVTGQNIANVNTPGYSRQRVQLAEAPPIRKDKFAIGVGVTVQGVQDYRDRFIESRIQAETGIAGRLTAQRDALAPVEAALQGAAGGGLQSSLNEFFNAFRDLDASPSSLPLRSVATQKGVNLAENFKQTRAKLDRIRSETDGGLRSTVDQVNDLTDKVATLNVQIRDAEAVNANTSALRDERNEVVKQISEFTGARSTENSDGTVTLTVGEGRALVIANSAFKLTANNTPPFGLASIALDGQPAVFDEGKIRGLQNAIAETSLQISDLDNLAAQVVARVNALHTSGTDSNNVAGVNFFVASGAPVTAANFSVNAAIVADPKLVVASPLAQPGQNGSIAGAISNLLNDPTTTVGARTGSFSSIYGSMLHDAGEHVRSADNNLQTQAAIIAQATQQREAVSGVSLDEEAINLMQYQKAYEAAARFLKIADEMTQTILSLAQ